jgi:hypothetical protein
MRYIVKLVITALPVEMVVEMTELNGEILSAAIEGLKRHDVAEEKSGSKPILVGLFRRWVEQKPGLCCDCQR